VSNCSGIKENISTKVKRREQLNESNWINKSVAYTKWVAPCRNCGRNDLRLLWKLPDSPLGDHYRLEKDKASQEELFSHSIADCESCGLLQLGEEPPIRDQYDNYLYKTSNTFGLGEYYKELANNISTKFLRSGDLVIDIGGNEGLLLKHFMHLGAKVLLIDPAPAAREAAENGIETMNVYFSEDLAETLMISIGQKAKVVTINYTLANIPNLDSLFSGILKVLEDDGIVSIITGYHPEQFQVNMIDYAGHDHLTFFSFEVLTNILERHGLKAIDVSRLEHKGGSIHVLAARSESSYETSHRTLMMGQREEWIWPNNILGIEKVRTRVEEQKTRVRRKLEKLAASKLKVFGVGASISTTYLINLFGIQEFIDFLVDDDINKIGRFSPMHSIEVKSFAMIQGHNIDTAMILSWQHTKVLTRRLRQSGFNGEVIIPLPELRSIHL